MTSSRARAVEVKAMTNTTAARADHISGDLSPRRLEADKSESALGRAGIVATGEFLQHPGADELFAGNTLGLGHLLDGRSLARLQRHLDGGGAYEDRLRNLLQFVLE